MRERVLAKMVRTVGYTAGYRPPCARRPTRVGLLDFRARSAKPSLILNQSNRRPQNLSRAKKMAPTSEKTVGILPKWTLLEVTFP